VAARSQGARRAGAAHRGGDPDLPADSPPGSRPATGRFRSVMGAVTAAKLDP